jgi:hypothetical protein
MKTLLITKSVAEVLAGVALLLIPSTVIWLALGVPLELSGAIAIARCIGCVLLAIGIACWMARNSESRGAIGLIAGLLVYDVFVVAVLLVGRLGEHLSGIALWPVIFLHSGLAAWSLFCLRKKLR